MTALGSGESPTQRRGAWPAALATAFAVLALLGAVAGLFLAWHYPLSRPGAVGAWVIVAAASIWWPRASLVAIPAALPAIGWMPWTGWLTFEEWDLLALAAGAGGYARLAMAAAPRAQTGRRDGAHLGCGPGLGSAMLALALLASVGVSLWRGFGDAGGFVWGWWQGYHEPMNSLRLAKPLVLAVWLLPLLRALLRPSPTAAAHALGLGLAGGLGVVSLLTVWERLAFTDLLNFSSDYRTTALFWEMHVGGAALDGFLVLTMPFAVRELIRPAAAWRSLLGLGLVMLGAYASLTTFSRGVYLALPLGLGLMAVLHVLQVRRKPVLPAAMSVGAHWMAAFVLAGSFAVGAVVMFPGSGYRGVLAAFAAFALLVTMAQELRTLPGRLVAAGVALGLVVALLVGSLAYLVNKGPYIVFAVVWCAGAYAAMRAGDRNAGTRAVDPAVIMLTSFVALLFLMPLVAVHWGGDRALVPAAAVSGLLAIGAVFGRTGSTPRWPSSRQWQASVLGVMASSAIVVGVMMGGAYMEDRFSTGDRDLQGRLQHWSRGIDLLRTPMDWAFGKGLGRYPANHFLSGTMEDQVGDYRWLPTSRTLVLTAGKHGQSWGSLFRVSQRVDAFVGPVAVELELRTAVDAGIHVEICRKHLLYDDGGCTVRDEALKAEGGAWQTVRLELAGKGQGRGDWFAPGFITFSMGVNVDGRSVEIRHVLATTANGQELLRNGDFSAGMAHWFFSSDRHHMPWHMKSMPLHLLFEQGWVGLMLVSALWVTALWRVSAGAARDHDLAPALAAALVGFAIVGLFDSLLDAPRVALVFYALALVAVTIPGTRSWQPRAERG